MFAVKARSPLHRHSTRVSWFAREKHSSLFVIDDGGKGYKTLTQVDPFVVSLLQFIGFLVLVGRESPSLNATTLSIMGSNETLSISIVW
jgi:hypothetical protein